MFIFSTINLINNLETLTKTNLKEIKYGIKKT